MRGVLLCLAACGSSGATAPIDATIDTAAECACDAPSAPPPTLDSERDRLLAMYYQRLHDEVPDTLQSNGLMGSQLSGVCDLWNGLSPSAQDVFLTITHRLWGAVDGLIAPSRALEHIVLLYRINGGDGSTSTDPGSCGGGEANRMIMSMDQTLHDVLVEVHGGAGDLADISPHGTWRQSNDAGGPHAPFDQSDETNDGAPRGQTQYFADTSSTIANTPIARNDIMDVTDPLALEMDQDYDCVHSSNPLCDYIFYGPACAPETQDVGTDIYTTDYGDFEPTWKPSGC